MRITFFFIMLLPYMAIYAQDSFYQMLRMAADSCYYKSVGSDGRDYKVQTDNSYFPFGYKPSMIQYKNLCRKRYKPKTIYIDGYNAILRKDTIILKVSKKLYFKKPYCRGHLYRRIDKFKTSSLNRCYKVLYVYDKETGWEEKKISKRLFIQSEDDYWLKNGVDLQDCIDFALEESINSFINNLGGLDIDKILVLDNTFGSDFFAMKYHANRAFPYRVASEQNLKEKDLKRFYCIFGWCEIFLTGKQFTIVLRRIDGRKYSKEDVDMATECKYVYDFAYSDVQKKWVCTKSLTIDHSHNMLTWKKY